MKSNTRRRALKALGMFGSLEALKMVCSVVRTKLVAIWIGAAGVGVISLYNATLEMLRSVAMLNLRQSAVPAIASADPADQPHIAHTVGLLGVIIGLTATLAVAILSPLLSLLTFGSYDYAWGFALLAPTMLAGAVADARSAIMQGRGHLADLARASLWAVLAATAVAIPLFYFFRMAAIVPVLIAFPVFAALFAVIAPASRHGNAQLDRRLFRSTAAGLVRLGSYLTAGMSTGLIADYALRAWLGRHSGIDTVGIFQAGSTVVKSYVGVFFVAMMMEFFPRVAATIRSARATSLVVGREIILTTSLICPLIVLFLSCNELIVNLLYSQEFAATVPYISIAATATALRAVSYCFSYVIIARGDGRIYLITESISAVSLLAFSYIGWTSGGFVGLGWAFVGQFAVFTAATWIAGRRRYGLRLPRTAIAVALASLAIAFIALALRQIAWWAPLPLLIPAAIIARKANA